MATTNRLGAKPPRPDPAKIRAALSVLTTPHQVIELRALEAVSSENRRPGTMYGYFDDRESLIEAASTIRATGTYITLNPCDRALLARAANRLKPGKDGHSTPDEYILCRRWLPIDVDPKRPSGISATDDEHTAALGRARQIREYLDRLGWPEPIMADAGNSGHVLYAIDLPNDDASRALVQRCLEALALKFDGDNLCVDQTVFNAARIWRLYGCLNGKGDSIADRPHRLSALLTVPASIVPVSVELLEALARTVPAEPRASSHGRQPRGGALNVATWIEQHQLEVDGPSPWKHVHKKWVFRTCPWNCDHTDRSAYIIWFEDGAYLARCHHDSCKGKDFAALRDMVEPGWRDRKHPPFATSDTSSGNESEDFEWPAPLPIPDALPPVEPFEPLLLPAAFRPWVEDIAERMQCPPDYPAVASMIVAGAVLGRRVGIRPKRHDDWLVVANLWGGVVGPPGVLKTPAVQEPMKHVQRLEAKATEDFAQQQRGWEAEQAVLKEHEKVIAGEMREALKSKDHEKAKGLAEMLQGWRKDPPVRKRLIINDVTVEKLGELLNQNPNGVLLYRDELTGFLRTLERDGHEGDRGFYLESWNGTGAFRYDRISRGTIDITAACVSILGSIQPGPLRQYLHGALQGGVADDGLMQRFQLLVWPDISGEWRNVDRWPHAEARQTAWEAISRVHGLAGVDIGATADETTGGIPFVRFTQEAQEIFDEWRSELEHALRRSDDHAAVIAHLAKYRSLIPSLALIIHTIDGGNGGVGADAITQACAWSEYLVSHARRLYAHGLGLDVAAAQALAGRIQARAVPAIFTAREVYMHHWAYLDTPDEVRKATAVLIDLDWLRSRPESTGGRPTERFIVNPRVVGHG